MKFKQLFTNFFLLLLTSLYAQTSKMQPTVHLHGRIQFDFEFLKRQNQSNWFNANEFRRVHLSVDGLLSPHFSYKVEVNIANATIGFRDVYLKYKGGKLGNFSFGSVLEPTGLDMATSSKYIPFFERAMLTSLQNFRWGAGFLYENYHLFKAHAGFQMSVTNNGKNFEGFKDVNLADGQNISTRFVAWPIFDSSQNLLLHVGGNYAYRPYKDLTFRPENHMGEKYHYIFPDAKNRQTVGFELATGYQSFSLQSEYKMMTLANNISKDYNAGSFYVLGSYFLTGEHRPYKHGAFGRVKPKTDVEHGGFGALELTARFSQMQFSNDVVAVNPGNPAEVNNLTVGLNWYLTSHIKLMYNYTLTDDKNPVLGNMTGHLLRIQMDF